jgi:DNA ligase-1
MRLAEVVRVADDVARTSKRTDKVAVLATLLSAAEPAEAPVIVGLLLGSPRQGRVGVGWATLAAVTGNPESSQTELAAGAGGNLLESSLTIRDVDEMFTDLALAGGEGSQALRHDLVAAVFARASAAEQWFLRRVFGGEMRQGANAGVVTDAVAKASGRPLDEVRRAAMLLGDLGHAAALALSHQDIASIGLSPLIGVQPMLASTAANVAAALETTGAASVEYKLDGARVQVHRRGDEVRVFTRTLNEISARVPEVVAAAMAIHDAEFVLDGEALGLDLDGNPLAFQDSMSTDSALRPFFFDVLYARGTSLIDEPLATRKRILREVVPADLLLPTIDVESPAEAADVVRAVEFAAAALDAGHEGVMVKALDSPYQAGRRGKTWLKVKPVHTFDLVVLAVEWGHGRRTGLLSNLHLGARGDDGEFVMVGKTFKGLTDQLLRWQTETFQRIATRTDGHVVHVRPEVVVEIAIDGVQRSTRYPGGVALRFARVKRYRDDKGVDEADSIERFQAML